MSPIRRGQSIGTKSADQIIAAKTPVESLNILEADPQIVRHRLRPIHDLAESRIKNPMRLKKIRHCVAQKSQLKAKLLSFNKNEMK